MDIVKRFYQCLVFLTITVITILVVDYITYHIQKDEQLRFNQLAHEEAVQVAEQIIAVLNTAQTLPQPKCDSETLNSLRVLTHHNSKIYDLGLIEGDTVLCSANWGKLGPIKIASNNETAFSSFVFYSQVSHLFPTDQTYSLVQKGRFFSVDEPNLYASLIRQQPHFWFQISTHDGQHVFYRYQPNKSKKLLFPQLEIHTKLCHDDYNFCVYIDNYAAGLAHYPPGIFFVLLFIAGLFGLIATYARFSFFQKRNSLESRFRKALKEKSLTMEYQPVIAVNDRHIIGVESLVRWHDSKFGRVSPEVFIAIAEKLHLYPKLSYFIAEHSVTEMAPILQRYPTFALGINIDTYEIQDQKYLPYLFELVQCYNINPDQIKIEITERISLPLTELSDFSQRAKSFGFNVVLDDFGTGVANLVWLTELDFDFIKVDRIFVNALNYDVKRKMVGPIMELLTSLNRPVIFEGVETQREHDIIKQNCHWGYIQGWYFYRSMPKSELDQLLAKQALTPGIHNGPQTPNLAQLKVI